MMGLHANAITSDRTQMARLRACRTAAERLSRATAEVVSAMMRDIEGDPIARSASTRYLVEADRDAEQALVLIRDCRRSLGDASYQAEGGDRDDLITHLARITSAIDEFLMAEVAGTPRDLLPFLVLDKARVLPRGILAEVREKQEQIEAEE